jgi:CheY-like chemotaxis protein
MRVLIAEAMAVLENASGPLVALLDCDMPGCGGLAWVRELRRRENCAAVYLVVLTANLHKPFFLEALYAGANDCLAKPIKASELKLRLEVGSVVAALPPSPSACFARALHEERLN